MKTTTLLPALCALAIITTPLTAQARHHHDSSDAFVGGMIFGTLVGAALDNGSCGSTIYYDPTPVYVTPPPVYVTPPPPPPHHHRVHRPRPPRRNQHLAPGRGHGHRHHGPHGPRGPHGHGRGRGRR